MPTSTRNDSSSTEVPPDRELRMRAEWVLPMSGKPIYHGEVIVQNGQIVEVRAASRRDEFSNSKEYTNAIIMPGLVNVHTHLDYTVMRGILEDIEFFPWIRELNARKAVLTWEDWVASATCGAAEAISSGIATIGDCTDSGAALYGAKSLGLGGRIYQEVFGIDELRTTEAIVEELKGKVDKLMLEAAGTRLHIGISPHAPYTVRPGLMQALAKYAGDCKLSICIHASESQAEADLIRCGGGPIAAMFEKRGIDWRIPGTGVVDYLKTLGILSPATLLVHGVQIGAEERTTIEQTGIGWAHCPKSNAKLGNGVADLSIMGFESVLNNGSGPPRIGIGSDSTASNNGLDLFEEMRFAVLMQRGTRRRIANSLTARQAVEMATIGGAKALGLDSDIGSLEPGKSADICVVGLSQLHNLPAYDPYNVLVYSTRSSDVLQTIVGGTIRYNSIELDADISNRFPGLDIKPAIKDLRAAAKKMSEWRPQ